MELIMLGTGNAMVTRCYNTCFVLSSGEEYFLVDAGGGNGIFKQLEQAGVPFDKDKALSAWSPSFSKKKAAKRP